MMLRLVTAAWLFVGVMYGQIANAVKLEAEGTTTLKGDSQNAVYTVSVAAGQTLLVEIDSDDKPYRNKNRVQVFGLGESTNPLVSSLTDSAINTWMYSLPETGSYRVTVNQNAKRRYLLRLTLMEPRDPRLDVGIRPEQISIADPSKQLVWDTQEFAPPSATLPLFGPAILESDGGSLHFTIASVEGFKKAWWRNGEGAKRMARLESALKSGDVSVDLRQLPGTIYPIGGFTFLTRKEIIQGPGIRALRWLWAKEQPGVTPANPIGYGAEGITTDGRFYIEAYWHVDHPAIPEEKQKVSGANLREFQAQLARKLEEAAPESFEPGLARLDAIVKSLTIR